MRTMITMLLLTNSAFAQIEKPATDRPITADTDQVTVEIRFLSGPTELFAELRANDLIRTSPRTDELRLPNVSDESLIQNGGIQLVSASRVIEQHQPVFVRELSDSRVRSIVMSAQESPRANLLFAPKVTLFDGQQAEINDITERPFVTGLTPKGTDHQPEILTVREGTRIGLRANVRGDEVRLDVCIRLTDVESVVEMDAGESDLSVQVPSVALSEIQLAAVVSEGESLAICGLLKEQQVRETGVPIQKKIPYVSRLFRKQTVMKSQEMLILLTPSIHRAAAPVDGR